MSTTQLMLTPTANDVVIRGVAAGENPNDATTVQQVTDLIADNGGSGSGVVTEVTGAGQTGTTTFVGFYNGEDTITTSGIVVSGSNNDNLVVNTVRSNSDIRYKKNIVPIKDTNKLMYLNPCTYTMKSDDVDKAGLIAQELEEIFPEMVDTNDKGYKSVDYNMLIPYMLKHIQKLTLQVEDLQKLNK